MILDNGTILYQAFKGNKNNNKTKNKPTNKNKTKQKTNKNVWGWWHMPLIPALWSQSQVDLSEFETSLVYRASCRTGSKVTQRDPVSKKPK